MKTPLSIAGELAILHAKYPDGLICTSLFPCDHRLVATTRAGYSKSTRDAAEPCPLSEAERTVYLCFACRQEAAERARLTEIRTSALAAGRAIAAQNRRTRTLTPAATQPPSADPHKQRGKGGRFRSTRALPPGSKRAGGRPRKHASDRARRTAAQTAWRARRRPAAAAAEAQFAGVVGSG